VYARLWVNRTFFKLKLGKDAFSTLSLQKQIFLSFGATTFWTHLLFTCLFFSLKEGLLQIWAHLTFSVIASCRNRQIHFRLDLDLLFLAERIGEVYLLHQFYHNLGVLQVNFLRFNRSFDFKLHIIAIFERIISFMNERTTWTRNSSLLPSLFFSQMTWTITWNFLLWIYSLLLSK